MKLLVSAAEASSDAHGAAVLKALRAKLEKSGESLDAFGIGGPALKAQGLRVEVDSRELLSMGTSEVLAKLPRILRALGRISSLAAREKPDLALVIDYPDFHFKLAARLRALRIPVVDFIPPKVWVWRRKRVRRLREDYVRVLGILPFEGDFYRDHGVDYRYVGNPLLDELPLNLSRSEARQHLGIEGEARTLVLMPGSRPAELSSHLELMLDAAYRIAVGLSKTGSDALMVLIPLPSTADRAAIESRVRQWSAANAERMSRLRVRVSQGDAHTALVAADAGLIKSGTSTLEAGLLRCPHVVVYKPSWLTGFLFKHVLSYRGPVGLVNLVANGMEPRDRYAMTELLCEAATVESLAREGLSLLQDPARRAQALEDCERLRVKIGVGGASPSERAAEEILSLYRETQPRKGSAL